MQFVCALANIGQPLMLCQRINIALIAWMNVTENVEE